jgi:hypothetical protein
MGGEAQTNSLVKSLLFYHLVIVPNFFFFGTLILYKTLDAICIFFNKQSLTVF